jgi:hypothetical protein
MRLSSLWRNRGPLWRRGAFILVLAAVAIGVYVMLPPEPRWVRVDEPEAVFDAGDGRIGTYRLVAGEPSGPLQLWDAATGEEAGRFLTHVGKFGIHARSDDGRYFVALLRVKGDQPDRYRISGVDLHERREWHVETSVGPFRSAMFSPGCNFVSLRLPSDEPDDSYAIVETSSGRVVSRVHLPATAEHASFSGDGGCLVLGYQSGDEDEPTNRIRVISTRTGQTAAFDDARVVTVSPDSRWLIADRGEEGIWVADLAASTWRCRLEGARHWGQWGMDLLHGENVFFAKEMDFTVSRIHTRGTRYQALVRLWSPTGRRIWRFGTFSGDNPTFSPDGRSLLWSVSAEPGQPHWGLYDVETGKLRWQRPVAGEPLFTPDSRRIVVARSDAAQVEVISAATGETERTIELTGLSDLQLRLTRDGGALVMTAAPAEEPSPWFWTKIRDWLAPRSDAAPMVIRVYDLDTGLELGRLETDETEDYWLTEDRRSLVTVYLENVDNQTVAATIDCWDLPPRKPLRWVAGAVVAAAVLLPSFRFGWRRLRARAGENKSSKT